MPMSLFKSIERNLNNPLPIMGIAAVFDLSKLSCSEMKPSAGLEVTAASPETTAMRSES